MLVRCCDLTIEALRERTMKNAMESPVKLGSDNISTIRTAAQLPYLYIVQHTCNQYMRLIQTGIELLS